MDSWSPTDAKGTGVDPVGAPEDRQANHCIDALGATPLEGLRQRGGYDASKKWVGLTRGRGTSAQVHGAAPGGEALVEGDQPQRHLPPRSR